MTLWRESRKEGKEEGREKRREGGGREKRRREGEEKEERRGVVGGVSAGELWREEGLRGE